MSDKNIFNDDIMDGVITETDDARKRPHSGSEGDNNSGEFTYKVNTRNRYAVLSDTSDSESEPDAPVVAGPSTKKTLAAAPKKIHPPPPIALHDGHDHRSLVNLINKEEVSKYIIKYTKDATVVQCEREVDRQKLLQRFQVMKINHHTYTDKNIKTRTYVIYGLSGNATAEQVETELKTNSVEVVKCAKMQKTKYPMFMATITGSASLDAMRKITEIDKTAIRWGKYITTKRITQCYNCQLWGHATSNCYASPKCMKCAGAHKTKDCVKTADTPAKCVNCNQDHPASSIACPMYARRKDWLDRRAEERRPPANRQYQHQQQQQAPAPRTFAPAPTKNPWSTPARPTQNASSAAGPSSAPQFTTSPSASSTFSELQGEMTKLSSLVDLQAVLQLIKNLNFALQKAPPSERLRITVEFLIGLNGK